MAGRCWATLWKKHVKTHCKAKISWGRAVPMWGQHSDSLILFSLQEYRRLKASLWHAKPLLADRTLRSGVNVLAQGYSQTAVPSKSVQIEQPQRLRILKTSWEIRVWSLWWRGKHFATEDSDSVTKWRAALSTFNVDPSGNTDGTGTPLLLDSLHLFSSTLFSAWYTHVPPGCT